MRAMKPRSPTEKTIEMMKKRKKYQVFLMSGRLSVFLYLPYLARFGIYFSGELVLFQ
jgi:hypothetical protein